MKCLEVIITKNCPPFIREFRPNLCARHKTRYNHIGVLVLLAASIKVRSEHTYKGCCLIKDPDGDSSLDANWGNRSSC